MLVTSFTTAAAFFSNTVNFVIPVGLFGFFMSLLVMINYAMVCTMFPAVIVLHHHWFAGRGRLRALGMGCLAPCGKQHLLTPAPAPASADTDCPAPSVADLRLLERWFQTCVSGFVWRRRAAIVGFSTILSLFVLFGYALQMDKATEAVKLWPREFPMEVYQRAWDKYWPWWPASEFACEPNCETVLFGFGALAVDDGSVFDFSDYGAAGASTTDPCTPT